MINFLKPIWKARLKVVGRVVKQGRTVGLVECDITDANAIARLVSRIRPDRCVHAAAAGARARCDDLDLLLRTNVSSAAALATSLADSGATRLVTLGSSSEYGTPLGAAQFT